jgi:hypothetical protein
MHHAARTFCLAAQVTWHECVRFWGETDEYLIEKTTRFELYILNTCEARRLDPFSDLNINKNTF